MTTETKTTIEPSDIGGIELSCPRCSTKVIFPIDKYDRLNPQCPSCNENWFTISMDCGVEVSMAMKQIKELMRLIGFLSGQRDDIHAKVRIHLKDAASKQPIA